MGARLMSQLGRSGQFGIQIFKNVRKQSPVLRKFIKKSFNSMGLDVRLTSNVRKHEFVTWEQKQEAMWRPFLAHLDIRSVIDIGANAGQFAALVHRLCPEASIISVEPLESCQEALTTVLNKIPGSRIIRAAAGQVPGLLNMNESEFSPCSSFLQPSKQLGEVSDVAAQTKTIEIDVIRLDDEISASEVLDDLLIKFDVQGYEIQAMRGAEKLLQRAKIVVCEVCFFRTLYEGQPLFADIHSELTNRGFTFMGNAEYLQRKSDGRVVEADAIFERLT